MVFNKRFTDLVPAYLTGGIIGYFACRQVWLLYVEFEGCHENTQCNQEDGKYEEFQQVRPKPVLVPANEDIQYIVLIKRRRLRAELDMRS